MPAPDESAESVADRWNICLIDDDEIMLSLFSRIIERSGCDAITAKGPEAAITLLATTPVDMVISDLRMPDYSDGEQLLNTLHELYPRLPIIMMSCEFSPVLRSQLLEAGATDCVAKPLTMECMVKLADALERP